jgi:tetratricopeptide (TPR) repeat protein
VCLGVGPRTQQPPIRGLTASADIAEAYDTIFDARFEDAAAVIERTCPPAPTEACQLLEVVNLWWQIQLDPYNRSSDPAFETQLERVITSIEAWTTREPARAEAWFYLGGAYGARVQFRVLRGARLSAVRDGVRIKDALERAIALDPTLTDAYFGIGLYHYYAAVAPPAARMLRWILMLPGGDRMRGLDEMHRAREGGLLVRDEADYQLHVIAVWYEKQYQQALEFLAGLSARHPQNPQFIGAAAEILDFYVDDTAASLKAWQALLDAADHGRVESADIARVNARLGIASQLDQLGQSDAAVHELQMLIASRPSAPFGAIARAQLQLGDALTHLGRREEAVAAYRTAIDAAGDDDPMRIATRARAKMRAQR